LTTELEKHKDTNDKLASELKLSKELIVQLERKLKQQETVNIRASRDLISTSGNAEVKFPEFPDQFQ
jgi:DNA-binding transcriptional regulator LsrR (DeoR family)